MFSIFLASQTSYLINDRDSATQNKHFPCHHIGVTHALMRLCFLAN